MSNCAGKDHFDVSFTDDLKIRDTVTYRWMELPDAAYIDSSLNSKTGKSLYLKINDSPWFDAKNVLMTIRHCLEEGHEQQSSKNNP